MREFTRFLHEVRFAHERAPYGLEWAELERRLWQARRYGRRARRRAQVRRLVLQRPRPQHREEAA